jgi:hypothetical protein
VLIWIAAGIAVYAYLRATAPQKLAAVGSFLAEDETVGEKVGVETSTASLPSHLATAADD